MSIVKEFREFIARGNVIDLAVGVIIGAAFNSIVKSLVDQVIMPPIGLLMGGLDFSKLEWVLKPEDPATAAVEKVAVQYGAFINTVIQFLIVAVVVFLLVKLVNQIRRADADEPAPTAPTPEEKLLTEIRDLLARPAAVAAPAAKAPAKAPAKPKA
ncbi:large-conductance mechanosensitive channel protein MscL [Caulobacter sp. UNC279MFTsu5.1]|uniref:large-conductance mechanosensitive channel protein MscL n=1 Tax=Caulobacter sp. UNC279MFTsu5.1 TaxID=1502775 RepID=UPI0008E6A554|nr:large-conductance mechanosensitive channel protein MscL [Caulobacter sp. UNC279MFTsu5.1]SFJ93019.1 large conductance mechanosensitive channel [Caulobacter sp. UNC279MFTsu5.1]